MQARGLMFFMPVESNIEVTDDGVQFKWTIAVPPVGQQIELTHLMPLDRSDLDTAKLQRQFMIAYHETQERLQGLHMCATEADLSVGLDEFNVSPNHAACGELCVICQEDLQCGEQAVQISSCGHCFHDECVRGWLLGCKQECPVCKVPVKAQLSVEDDENLLAPGTEVVLTGLQNRPELNGLCGHVKLWLEARERYQVIVAETGQSYLLSRRNLQPTIDNCSFNHTREQQTMAEHSPINPIAHEPESSFSSDVDEDDTLAAAIALSMQTVTDEQLDQNAEKGVDI